MTVPSALYMCILLGMLSGNKKHVVTVLSALYWYAPWSVVRKKERTVTVLSALYMYILLGLLSCNKNTPWQYYLLYIYVYFLVCCQEIKTHRDSTICSLYVYTSWFEINKNTLVAWNWPREFRANLSWCPSSISRAKKWEKSR